MISKNNNFLLKSITTSKLSTNEIKQFCQKRGWIMSVVIENNIKRLVDNLN